MVCGFGKWYDERHSKMGEGSGVLYVLEKPIPLRLSGEQDVGHGHTSSSIPDKFIG